MAGVIQDLLVTYHNMAEPSVRRQVVVTLPNSAWFGCAKREAVQAGPAQPVEWSKTELAREVPTERVAPFGTEAAAVDGAGASTMIGGALRGRTPLEQELAPSLVTVDFTRPFVRSCLAAVAIDNVHSTDTQLCDIGRLSTASAAIDTEGPALWSTRSWGWFASTVTPCRRDWAMCPSRSPTPRPSPARSSTYAMAHYFNMRARERASLT